MATMWKPIKQKILDAWAGPKKPVRTLILLRIVHKAEEMDIVSGCVGWELEGLQRDEQGGGSALLGLRLGQLVRLRLVVAAGRVRGWVELMPPGLPLLCCCELAGAWLHGS
jgi:hypothetical protein